MKGRCGLEDCDCEYTIEKLLKALEVVKVELVNAQDDGCWDAEERCGCKSCAAILLARAAIREARGG